MKVSIIGQGYVGLSLAASASGAGCEVVGFDTNQKLVTDLNVGKSHVEGVVVPATNYQATADASEIDGSDAVIIAVPTPLNDDRKPNLSYLVSASEVISKALKNKALIINESTSFPGTLRDLIAKNIGEISGIEHLYAASPERVDPGNELWNQANTPRLVAGLTEEATKAAVNFYS